MKPAPLELVLLIAAGGALGALARFGATAAIGRWAPETFPWGTFLVNVSGSLLLGVLVGLPASTGRLHAFAAIGAAGAFTTFSTFSYESVLLLQAGSYGRAAVYMGGSVILATGALLLGLTVAGVLAQRI